MPRRTAVLGMIALAAMVLIAGPSAASRPHRALLSGDLVQHLASRSSRPARVIVRGDAETVSALVARHGGKVKRWLAGGASVEVTPGQLAALQQDGVVDRLSGDLPVQAFMSVTNPATGADRARQGSSGLLGLLGGLKSVSGAGVGVAVIDSGIAPHSAVARRVVATVDFTGGNGADEFGHGTHVAGIIGGSAAEAGRVPEQFDGGIAPGVSLINVRVLGANGGGYTSDVIAGIDWVVANRRRYNIRLINLSLGHPVTESSETDPLCLAVRRAVEAGIVVVASAGNYGRTADGAPVLGGITSPGNSPYAITVGSLDTLGTESTADDAVAAYSSRGPTKYDFAAKPDVVAPGHRLVSLESPSGYLVRTYPQLHVWGSGKNAYLRLSGTSMATPVVTGGIALLLESNSSLTPAHVKIALQTTATHMPDAGLIGAGAGRVNFFAARKVVNDGLLASLTSTLLGGLLQPPAGVTYFDRGTLIPRVYDGPGFRLLSLLELPLVWLSPSRLAWGDLNVVSASSPFGSLQPKGIIWGEAGNWTESNYIVWGAAMRDENGDYIVWGSADTNDYIVWGSNDPAALDDAPRR